MVPSCSRGTEWLTCCWLVLYLCFHRAAAADAREAAAAAALAAMEAEEVLLLSLRASCQPVRVRFPLTLAALLPYCSILPAPSLLSLMLLLCRSGCVWRLRPALAPKPKLALSCCGERRRLSRWPRLKRRPLPWCASLFLLRDSLQGCAIAFLLHSRMPLSGGLSLVS